MNRKYVHSLLSLLLSTLPLSVPLVSGCNNLEDSNTLEVDTGDANIGVTAQALSANDVTKLTVTVTGAGIAPAIVQDLFKVNGQWVGTLGSIPVGTNRTFHADAYDAANTKLYEGEATGVTISSDAPAVVVLVLQQKTAPTPFANSAPQITALTTSAGEVAQGESVSLAATATDPDNDPLTYTWTATGGSFSNASVESPNWIAPAADGVYTLSVSVTDGKGGQAGLSVQITVGSEGSANLSTAFNTWPVVNQLSASPGQLKPGESSSLNVAATDADGQPLTYAWSSDCGGSFSDAALQNPTWTAPAAAPPGGTCTLTAAVSDNAGGSTSGTLLMGINLPNVDLPPNVDQYFQSSSAVLATEEVMLSVNASDPEGGMLSFAWSATGGTLGMASSSASSSQLVWTAPPASGTFTITATVEDSTGQQAQQSFTATVAGACNDGLQNYGETGVDCGGPCDSCGNVFTVDESTLAVFELNGDMNDSSGNNRHVATLGAATFASTDNGAGLVLNGTNSQGFTWTPYANLLVHPFTVELVYKSIGSDSYAKLFGVSDNSDSGWYELDGAFRSYPSPLSLGFLPANVTHYVAIVSLSATTMQVYIDGASVGTTGMNLGLPPSNAIFFRDDNVSEVENITGVADAVRISSVARSASEISTVWTAVGP